MSHKRNWKGVPWIKTPFAFHYRRRRALAVPMVAGALAQGQAQIRAIRFSRADRAEKMLAIARAQAGTFNAAAKAAVLFLKPTDPGYIEGVSHGR